MCHSIVVSCPSQKRIRFRGRTSQQDRQLALLRIACLQTVYRTLRLYVFSSSAPLELAGAIHQLGGLCGANKGRDTFQCFTRRSSINSSRFTAASSSSSSSNTPSVYRRLLSLRAVVLWTGGGHKNTVFFSLPPPPFLCGRN